MSSPVLVKACLVPWLLPIIYTLKIIHAVILNYYIVRAQKMDAALSPWAKGADCDLLYFLLVLFFP